MKYYYLKIGKSNKLAKEWLEGKNPLNKPAAVIFFGTKKVKDLLREEGTEQAVGFCKAGLPQNRKKVVALVISDGELWLLRPKGEVREVKKDSKSIWKAMEVKIIKKVRLNYVPPILASIGSNRYLSGGTFREIKPLGNIKAIKTLLNGTLSKKHYYKKYLTSLHLLECLSSVELETLIAKLFESVGCFVPAYRGGYMKDIDIFATNETNKKINLDGILLEPSKTISIQVKTKLGRNTNSIADYFIALDAMNKENIYNADWLLNQVKKNPVVFNWFSKSVSWLPANYLAHFKIKKVQTHTRLKRNAVAGLGIRS